MSEQPAYPPQAPGTEGPPPPYPDYKEGQLEYPPQGQPGYPPQGQPGYPPQGQAGYPPQGQPAYPPQGQPAYPPEGQPAYPPQGQPGYPPQGQPVPQGQPGYAVHQPTAVVVGQPTVTTIVQQTFREYPVRCQCPNCHRTLMSHVTYTAGTLTWLLCLIMFLFGLWICCLMPFCIDSCQDATHHCSHCKYQLGTFTRM